jgi:class 3 adenylate cyclase
MKPAGTNRASPGAKKASVQVSDDEMEFREENLLDYLAKHAPYGWEKEKTKYIQLLKEYLDHEKPLRMIVLSADIRKSTFLMQESVSFRKFAQLMGRFINRTATLIESSGGWFDKFTGDGFLAYWLNPEEKIDYAEFLSVCQILLGTFKETGMDIFRKNCRNFPAGVGLSLGIDAGDAYMVTMAGDLTIVGPPVVGAVRMSSAAEEPWETVCNVFLGYALFEKRTSLLAEYQIEVRREYRKTKEYEEQEVYPIVFHGRTVSDVSSISGVGDTGAISPE